MRWPFSKPGVPPSPGTIGYDNDDSLTTLLREKGLGNKAESLFSSKAVIEELTWKVSTG